MTSEEELDLLRRTNLALRDTLDGYLALRDTARTLLSRPDTPSIASELAGSALLMSGARRADVYVAVPGQTRYAHAATRPEKEPAPAELDIAPDVLLWILRERKAMTVPGAGGEDRMVIPLFSARLCEGFLAVHFPPEHQGVTEEIQEKLQTLAVSASAAIQNVRLTESLSRTGAYLTDILESVTHGICVVDMRGRITRLNNNFVLMFDLESDRNEMLEKPLGDFLPESVWLVFQEVTQEAQQEGFALDRLLERKDAGGNDLALGISVTFLKDSAGQKIGMIYLVRDMTASRELERLRRLTQLKSEFVNNVSHELRTPLTSIKAYTEALQDMVAEETPRKFLGVIAEESDRLLDMIENLLNVSRIESGKLRLKRDLCAPAELVASVLSVSKVQIGKHELLTEIAPDLPRMSLDVNKMKEVLLNLLSNAIKYSPDGGEIRVSARVFEGNLRIDIADSGIGISPENVKRLFEPFFRVESEQMATIRGTGLGLAITKKIVEAHGGSIQIASVLGRGSTFTILLPIVSPSSEGEIDYGAVPSSPFA